MGVYYKNAPLFDEQPVWTDTMQIKEDVGLLIANWVNIYYKQLYLFHKPRRTNAEINGVRTGHVFLGSWDINYSSFNHTHGHGSGYSDVFRTRLIPQGISLISLYQIFSWGLKD